jgi:queuosine precursor transporter
MRGKTGMNTLLVVLYLAVIVCANVVTASFAPISLGVLLVPAGSFLIGATFILRDLVQNAVGRGRTYATIGAAMLISALTSHLLGDMLWIVFASALTFLVSETSDTEIYSRLKLPLAYRMLYSGIVGGLIDSVLFVIIGLSPLFSGILPWGAVGYAILGQIIVKLGIQVAGALVAGYFTGASSRERAIRQ